MKQNPGYWTRDLVVLALGWAPWKLGEIVRVVKINFECGVTESRQPRLTASNGYALISHLRTSGSTIISQ